MPVAGRVDREVLLVDGRGDLAAGGLQLVHPVGQAVEEFLGGAVLDFAARPAHQPQGRVEHDAPSRFGGGDGGEGLLDAGQAVDDRPGEELVEQQELGRRDVGTRPAVDADEGVLGTAGAQGVLPGHRRATTCRGGEHARGHVGALQVQAQTQEVPALVVGHRLVGDAGDGRAVEAHVLQRAHRLTATETAAGDVEEAGVDALPHLGAEGLADTARRVAGCPPDYFAADGQLWGNPLYDWPVHKATGFAWWKQRMKHATSIYDVVRIDHFRGFESYYSIPAGNKTAAGGHWEKGPDRDFINAMHENLGEGGIIAEDLGYLTPEVKAMLSASGYPGMKIMQFAFDSREPGNYLPYTYPHNSVVYTGTHDNVTTEGWRQSASPEDVHYACRYLRCLPEDLTEAMICACLASVSDMAIIPMADWLHLGAEARINTPSTQGANWQWRLDTPLTSLLAEHIADLTALYDRAPAAADR